MRTAILALLAERSAGATICPSEAARRVAGEDWRGAMHAAHAAAAELTAEGRVRLTQSGKKAAEPKGAYRIRRA